jgi:hypothetical protein
MIVLQEALLYRTIEPVNWIEEVSCKVQLTSFDYPTQLVDKLSYKKIYQ